MYNPPEYIRIAGVKLWTRLNIINDEDSCWEFTGSVKNGRYGQISICGVIFAVHKLAYLYKVGPIKKGFLVCHTCDNTICCRPKHLFTGTNTDNILDMIEKGRAPNNLKLKNGLHGNSRLTEEQVIEIRARYKYGYGHRNGGELAKEFGVSIKSIYSIVHRQSWKHI